MTYDNLTVVIPTFSRDCSLRRAVASALSDNSSVGQVIVVDDNVDLDYLKRVEFPEDSRLKIIRNRFMQGPSGARNSGVSEASYATILFLDDDDEIVPGYPCHILRLRNTHKDLVYGFSSYKTHSGLEVRKSLHSGYVRKIFPKARYRFGGLGMGFWMDKGTFFDVGCLDQNMKSDEDTDLQVRLISRGYNGWFASEIGVSVDRSESPKITNRNKKKLRERYVVTLLKNMSIETQDKELFSFLLYRALKVVSQQYSFPDFKKFICEMGLARVYTLMPLILVWRFKFLISQTRKHHF
jgi:glycosyltransferase involved in cell wall biosynthesis